MKTKTWILIFAVLIVVCAAGMLLLCATGQDGQTVQIWSNGELYKTVNLSKNQYFYVKTGSGSNTVVIDNGTVFVSEASCPDGICIAHGVARPNDPIVCLPNQLIVEITGADAEIDAATD